MKAIVFAVVIIGLLDSIKADDDGRYRPEVYNDRSGRYYNYNNYYNGRNRYYPNYSSQQQYYDPYRPYQQLVAPAVAKTDSSVISTAQPAVVTTAQPLPKYVYTKNYGNEGYARIIEQENDQNESSYQYKYKTENGISAGETGIVDTASPQGGTRVQGFYEYIGDDGLTYRVDYVADENGYRATGAHLPKA